MLLLYSMWVVALKLPRHEMQEGYDRQELTLWMTLLVAGAWQVGKLLCSLSTTTSPNRGDRLVRCPNLSVLSVETLAASKSSDLHLFFFRSWDAARL